MLQVFITVDTEVWPETANWRETRLADDLQRDIQGLTPHGDFGAYHQAKMLHSYGLKGVFFVESLYSFAVGTDSLKKTVEHIQGYGHEIGLHTHSEWLKRVQLLGPGITANSMHELSEDQQACLISKGIEQLKLCGVDTIASYRAGGFGANFDTLRAVKRNNILYDSSHNACFLNSTCKLHTTNLLTQPEQFDGVYEFPVSVFRDWPGHLRPTQLCACSASEMQTAIMNAWRENWRSVVIVSHSFELINRGPWGRRTANATPDWIVMKRFEKLCQFLADNRSKFRTTLFQEIEPPERCCQPAPLQGRWYQTAVRIVEQARRKTT